MSRIHPKCINGYAIDCKGAGRLERTPEGERLGIPEPIVGNCCHSEGLCWWLQPIGFSFSLTLPVANIRKFWRG